MSEIISMPVPQIISQVDPLVHILERIVRDPSIPIERLEQVEALLTRRLEQQDRREFHIALAAVQEEMKPVAVDASNPSTKSKYASYVALDRALRPIYTKHGFGLSFNTKGLSADEILIMCDVSHNGYVQHYEIPMPRDGKGAKGGEVMTRTHATGSAATYGQRYLLKLIFNVAVGEYDDDGNGAGANDTLNSEQMQYAWNCVNEFFYEEAAKGMMQTFVAAMGHKQLTEIPASKWLEFKGRLDKWHEGMTEKNKNATADH